MYLLALLYFALRVTVTDPESFYKLWIRLEFTRLSCKNSATFFEFDAYRCWLLCHSSKFSYISFSDQCCPYLPYSQKFKMFSLCSVNTYYPIIHRWICWIQKEVHFYLLFSVNMLPSAYFSILFGRISRILSPIFF